MASSSSSHVQQTKYDVFISFRGSDIRHGFLSHLTTALRQKHIDVYVDERLERGDEIEPALVKAIEGSAISLVIFSKDYASSKWCLEELVKIIECKELYHQIVIPVFYNVDPSDVRHQTGTFEDAFAQHEQSSRYNMGKLQSWRSALNKAVNLFGYLYQSKFENESKHEQRSRYNMGKVQSWRSALSKAANLSGYHYPSQFQNESKLIDEVVKHILEKLDDIYPTIESNGLVGFDGNLACVESLLEIESQEVRIVGLWGMGGIGKTTLARAICNKFSAKFESCCFLENVREESKRNNGLNYFLQKLFSTLLGEENVNVNDVVKMKSVKRRLCRKKILLVLDDIDTSEQLKDLAGEQPYLGAGSKVIITSRNKHVLISGGVHENAIYEIKELNFQDSLKLFSLNAFNHSLPMLEYEELSKQAVGYAKGIPLVLKVLGSHLHSRDIKTWQSVLGKLKKHPNVQIQNVMKVSYDGLDDIEKEIFLDIAFFFKGQKKDDVIRVLDACNFYASSGIATLLDKALITISNFNEIQMHDLLEEMAEQIVREESIKNPGRRSRLKDIEEVLDVLKNNKGTDAIEGIALNLSQINEDIQLSNDIFNKMSNLRILKISSPWGCKYLTKLPFGLKPFPSELRYLHWDGCPLKSLPLASFSEKLVELCLIDSDVQKLWDGVQDLVSLKKIDFRGSKQLTELPDFSKARNLEVVDLSYCQSLCSVHPSILSCHTLVSLNLFGCQELRSLQSKIHFESLDALEVRGCYNLKEFSLSSEKVDSLYLDETKIEMLHSSIGLFKVLSKLYLNCSTLKSLPIKELRMLTCLSALSICDYKQVISKRELSILFEALPNLEGLNLNGCINLFEIPDNINALSRLEWLFLNKSGVETLPASIKHLLELCFLYLKDCRRLRFLPELPPSITFLDFNGSTSLETLPTSMKHILELEEVHLKDCRRLECLPELPPSITTLDVTGCTSLERVHNLPLSQVKHVERHYNWEFSFLGCMKMDEQSLCNVMEFTHISMMRPPYVSVIREGKARVCYPGSRVPKWLKYKDTQKANSVTFKLPPSSQPLLGFVYCCILSQLPFTYEDKEVAEITCAFCQIEGLKGMAKLPSVNLKELNTDHVFLWYRNVHKYYNITSSELEFEFFLGPRLFGHDDLIKACGVSPIYASENYNIFKRHQDNEIDNDDQMMINSIKHNDDDDDDDEQLLPPTKKLKQSCCTNKSK